MDKRTNLILIKVFTFFLYFSATVLSAFSGISNSISEDRPQQSSWGFIENRGQFTTPEGNPLPQVKFVTNRPGMRLTLTNSGFSYEWQKLEGVIPAPEDHFSIDKKKAPPFTRTTYRVDVKLVGANPNALIKGTDANIDYINYYNVPQYPEGILEVHNYAKVIYHDVYPNIDWILYSKPDGSLKYDFFVHPGGDPKDIVLEYDGTSKFALSKAGVLQIVSPFGETQEDPPLTLQSKRIIASRYVLDGNRVQFELGDFDRSQDLIIDPCLRLWGSYYGGSGEDRAYFVSTDVLGNVYLAGFTLSFNNISFSGQQNILEGNSDAFLVKFNSAGVRLWATYYGGNSDEFGNSVSSDAFGNVYLVGQTYSSNNISSMGYQNIQGGEYDAFLVKFSASGVRSWATYYGGENDDYGKSVAADEMGNVYIAGITSSNNGISFNGHQNSIGGGQDAFIVKFSTNGIRLWGSYYGGFGLDYGNSIALDPSGHVYLTGVTNSTENISFNGFQNNKSGTDSDAFLAKFSSNGIREWSTYYGGNNFDWGNCVTADGFGNVYIAGVTLSNNNISFNGHQNIFVGGSGSFPADAFLAKFSTLGTRIWATYYGGTDIDEGNSVATDSFGNVYLAGRTLSPDNIASVGHQNTYGGNTDGFLVSFNASGTRLSGTYFGGSGIDDGNSVAVDASGYVFLAGWTQSSNAINLEGHQNTFGGGFSDAFLVKFSEVVPIFTSPTNYCSGAIIPNLATTSNNGIVGSWSPAINNTTTTTYTFTPSSGQCATTTTLTITISPTTITPSFSAVEPYCNGSAIPSLPTTSNNDITGSWSPAINNNTTTTYTFTPDAGQCASNTTLTISISPVVNPEFSEAGPYCNGVNIPPLPVTSNNGITGIWSPAINNVATTTYTFTPNDGQCATAENLTIEIHPPINISFSQTSANCPGLETGSLVSSASGGNPPYSYSWNNGSNESNLQNIVSGDYTLTVTDNAGCTQSANTKVTNSFNPNVSLSGNNFLIGETYQASWGSFPDNSLITLGVSNNAGANWENLLSNQPAAGATSITLPASLAEGSWQLKAEADNGCTAIFNFEVYFVTVIENLVQFKSFSVFPNPANELIHIMPSSAKNRGAYVASLFDITGRIIHTQASQGAQTTIHTRDLPAGIYLIRLESDQGTEVKKVVVKH